MKKIITVLILYFALTVPVFPVIADTLLVEGIEQEPGNSLAGIPRPNRGMEAEKVIEIFGQPASRSVAVGTPPIQRWYYRDFIVVLENRRVIHAIVRKASQEALAADR